MREETKNDNSSGAVRLQGDKIFWDYHNENIFQIDINDIVVIGEHTNSDGPYFDDWFLTFVIKSGQWQSIPIYADNFAGLTQYLTNRFHEDLTASYLVNPTEWRSVVMYPIHLKGKPLFTLTPSETYKPPKTFFDKILYGIGFGNFDTTQNIALTEEVKNELASAIL